MFKSLNHSSKPVTVYTEYIFIICSTIPLLVLHFATQTMNRIYSPVKQKLHYWKFDFSVNPKLLHWTKVSLLLRGQVGHLQATGDCGSLVATTEITDQVVGEHTYFPRYWSLSWLISECKLSVQHNHTVSQLHQLTLVIAYSRWKTWFFVNESRQTILLL